MKSDRLQQEFSSLESMEAPELLPDIAQRIELGPVAARPDGPGYRTRTGRVILALGVLGGVIAGVLVLARVLPTDSADRDPAGAGPIPESAIVLGTIENGLTRLYVIEEDGSGFTNPTANGSPLAIPGYSLNVSPDASRATFIRTGGQERGVWVSRIDGSEAVRLTEATSNGDENPAWSPDGRVIVFSRNRVGHAELFTINADGSNLTQITSNDVGQDVEPAWSPDGSSIVFARNSGGPIDLWVVGTDGSAERQLTHFEVQSSSAPSDPDWSPDGARIVFAAAPPGADREDVRLPPRDLWAIDADGTNLTRLTDTPQDEVDPRWSPDGEQIVFLSGSSRDSAGTDLRGPYSLAILELSSGETRTLQAPMGSLFDTSLQWLRHEAANTPEPTATPAISSVVPPNGLSATRMAIGEGATWALASTSQTGSSVLVRIDSATAEVVATISVEGDPWYVAAGGGVIWVGSPQSSMIQRVDAATNELRGEIQLPGEGVGAIAGDDHAVWVEVIQDRSDQGQQNIASLVRIDPQTSEIVATVPLEGLSGYDDEIAIGGGAVWVAGVTLTGSEERGANLVRIDPTTNAIGAVIPVSAFSVRAGEDAVWVTQPADGVNDSLHKPESWVAREIDPTSSEVSAPIPLPGNVSGVLAVAADGVWFSGYDEQGLIHPVRLRGGAFDASVPPIDSVYTDMAFDDASGTIWVAAVNGLERIDMS